VEKSLPFPKELVGRSYDDPVVMKAYLSYCRRMVEFFRPDYLGIGIEVNEVYLAGPNKWRAYAALHRHVCQELKRDHPDLPIFTSLTLHGMLNETGRKREEMLTAFQEIMPYNDLVAVSFYPFIRGGTTDIDGCLRWLTEHFDVSKKPYVFVEVGEPAERLRLPSSGQIIDGTPQKQAAFYATLLAFAQEQQYPLRDQLSPPGLRRLVGEDQAFLAGGVHGVAGLRVAGPRREGTPRLHGVETVLRGPSCQVIGGPDPRRGHRVILALFFGSANHQSPCPASHSKSGCTTQSTTHFPSSWVKQTIPALRNLTTSISGFPVTRRLTKRLR